MAGALGLVLTGDTVPTEGRHAIPVYVDDTLPIVGPSRACVIADGVNIPFAGGPPLAVRLAPAGTPAIGPALPVYVVPGGGSLGSTTPALDLTLGGALTPALVLLADPSGTNYAGQTTLYQDTGLTTPAVAVSDPVKGWKDVSGNGRHYLQGTINLFPLRDVIGTVAAVAFDGTNDNLSVNAAYAVAQPVTYIAILRRGANDSGPFIVRGAQSDSASYITATGNITLYAGSATAPSVACGSGTSAVVVGVFNGASSQLWVNGGAQSVGNPGALGVRNVSAAMIGAANPAGASAANVKIGAFLIYPGALSLAQINALAIPLGALWGITAGNFT